MRKILGHFVRLISLIFLVGGIIAGIIIHEKFAVPTYLIGIALFFWSSLCGLIALIGPELIGD